MDGFQLFMFCLWVHVIRAEKGNLLSSCAIKRERTLISGLLEESLSHRHVHTIICEATTKRVEQKTEGMQLGSNQYGILGGNANTDIGNKIIPISNIWTDITYIYSTG